MFKCRARIFRKICMNAPRKIKPSAGVVEVRGSGGGQDRRVEDAQISISSDWDGHLLLLLRALGMH